MQSPTGSPSRTHEAYERLRQEIIRGEIRPNERLVAADLAERLEISRTPVREALQLLAAEGMVISAKRGYAVQEHGHEAVREIYEIRAALEGMAARLAAERASDEDLEKISRLGAHLPSLNAAPRIELVEANDHFHSAILEAAGNPRLCHLSRRNTEYFFNYQIAQQYSDEEARASVEGHARILEALKERDPDAADAAARQHIFDAIGVTVGKMR